MVIGEVRATHLLRRIGQIPSRPVALDSSKEDKILYTSSSEQTIESI